MPNVSYIDDFEKIPRKIDYIDSEKNNKNWKEYKGKKYTYLGNALQYKDINWYDLENWKSIAKLIIVFSLAFFVLPVIFSSYRNFAIYSYKSLYKENISFYWSESIPAWKKINFMNQEEKDKFKKFRLNPKDFFVNEVKKIKGEWDPIDFRNLMKDFDNGRIDEEEYDALFGRVMGIPENFSLWMRGVAIVASYLIEKHGLPKDRLFVCQDLEAMKTKISEIAASKQEGRYALVVPHRSGLSNISPDYPQHKVAVCIEKAKSGMLRLALLDAQPVKGHNDSIDLNRLQNPNFGDIKTDEQLNTQEAIYKRVLEANLDGCQLDFCFSTVMRETQYGCESFALEDCLNFLKRDSFFFDLNYENSKNSHLPNGGDIKVISKLPPEFMAGTQSMTLLNQYREKYKEKTKQTFPSRLNKSLKQSSKKYAIKQGDRVQNHRITWKAYKNMRRVMNAVKFLSEKEIDQVVDKVLLKTETQLIGKNL